MTESVSASVAKILGTYSVALNRGNTHGIRVGDRVTLWRDEEIVDPDNGQELGSTRVENLRMRVSELDERFCIAEVPRETSSVLFANFPFTVPRKTISTSPANEDDIVVRVGDPATIYSGGREE